MITNGKKFLAMVGYTFYTFSSHLIMNKVDLVTVKEFLGHSSISTTMIYSHLSTQHKINSIEKLHWS